MKTITLEQAESSLDTIINETASNHHPIHIAGTTNTGVLISDDDWRAIQETLYLLSVPSLRESILAEGKTPVSECAQELSW
jgi:antitoxin YefM